MNLPMNESREPGSIEERIFSVRRAIRSRQPLEQRIDLVRTRHRIAKKKAAAQTRTVRIRLDGAH